MDNEFNPAELAKSSKTFCIMPWVHQYAGPTGDIKPCCVYEHQYELGNLKNNTLKEIWNSSESKDLRLKLLNGEMHVACNRCEHVDARPNLNNKFLHKNIDTVASTLPDGTVEEHKIVYMDIRFNNLCNFSCRTCSPHFSTSWVTDFRKLHNITTKQEKNDGFQYPGNTEEQVLNEILPHLGHMQEIYFAGGEPMMQIEHYEVLKNLVELGNTDCRIRYNTNFSRLQLGEHDVIDYWKKFNNILLCVSIDGSHTRAEYWRHGTDWDIIVANRTRLLEELPNIEFHIAYTLSWVNAHDLVKFHKEWIELGYLKPNNIDVSLMTGPDYYVLYNIPDWKKEQIEKLFREHIEWLRQLDESAEHVISLYESAIAFMWKTPDRLNETIKHFSRITKKLDEIRDENFFDTFSEHDDMKQYMTDNNLHATFDY